MSSGYVPCAGTVPQQLGVVTVAPPIIDPSHSVPDFAANAGVTDSDAGSSGDANAAQHYGPDQQPAGVPYSGPANGESALAAQHYGPAQNDSGAQTLPPLVGPTRGTEIPTTSTPDFNGTIYTDPTGPQTYIQPGVG